MVQVRTYLRSPSSVADSEDAGSVGAPLAASCLIAEPTRAAPRMRWKPGGTACRLTAGHPALFGSGDVGQGPATELVTAGYPKCCHIAPSAKDDIAAAVCPAHRPVPVLLVTAT